MAEYARPQPTINTNIEEALLQIGQFEYMIVTDLSDSYYQITLNPESAKYLGIISETRIKLDKGLSSELLNEYCKI